MADTGSSKSTNETDRPSSEEKCLGMDETSRPMLIMGEDVIVRHYVCIVTQSDIMYV